MRHQRRPAPRHQGQPSPKLAGFLAATLGHVRAGAIGRETARDAIRAWPAIHPSDVCAKSAAIRELAAMKV